MSFVNNSTGIVPYILIGTEWYIGSGKCRSLHLNWIFELLSHSTDDFDTFLGLSGKKYALLL